MDSNRIHTNYNMSPFTQMGCIKTFPLYAGGVYKNILFEMYKKNQFYYCCDLENLVKVTKM